MREQARCPRCKKLTVDEWVHRLNAKTAAMAIDENMTHPSSWHELMKDDREAWTRIAQMPTCDCEATL